MNILVIGNKNYSSWSLRAWLMLKEFGISFTEKRIPLYTDGFKQHILEHSPSGLVPALCMGDMVVWDSLAICEYVADVRPDLACWPRDLHDRALARSVSHEMHSGFHNLRSLLPMNCRKTIVFTGMTAELQADIDRISAIWQRCRALYSGTGPFLFGHFTIADAMYAPVVLRFKSYGIAVGDIEQEYMQTIFSLESLQEWIAGAVAEQESLDLYEVNE